MKAFGGKIMKSCCKMAEMDCQMNNLVARCKNLVVRKHFDDEIAALWNLNWKLLIAQLKIFNDQSKRSQCVEEINIAFELFCESGSLYEFKIIFTYFSSMNKFYTKHGIKD